MRSPPDRRARSVSRAVSLVYRQTGQIKPVVLPLLWFEEVRPPRSPCPGHPSGEQVWAFEWGPSVGAGEAGPGSQTL